MVDADWTVPAGDLSWSCRRTLDHIPDALLLYARSLATRANDRQPFLRDGDPKRSIEELLAAAVGATTILAEVARAAPPSARAFHPAGMADSEGFVAMGCDEILIHTSDIASGLDVPFSPPPDLADAVLRRLFPWAPQGNDPWDTLRWANGRVALPDSPRLDELWYWHPAPLATWDGIIKRRERPPAW
ncbi:MAG: hypothetical protein WD739_08680 [Actinomycetota bacterium]